MSYLALVADSGSQVSVMVPNTDVGNSTGSSRSHGEHVLPQCTATNFPVGFLDEHVLSSNPTASINSLQPNTNTTNNVVNIDQALMGNQGPIELVSCVTQNVNTYANEVPSSIQKNSSGFSKPTQSLRDVNQMSDVNRALMSSQVSYSPIIAVDDMTRVQGIMPGSTVVHNPIVTHQPISINKGQAPVKSVSVTLGGPRSSARVYNPESSRLLEQQQRPNYGINLPVYNAVNHFPRMDDNTARALYNQNAMQLQGYCNPFGVFNPFMLPQQGMFSFPTGYSSQSIIDREHSDTIVTSVPVTSQPTSIVSSGSRPTARPTQSNKGCSVR